MAESELSSWMTKEAVERSWADMPLPWEKQELVARVREMASALYRLRFYADPISNEWLTLDMCGRGNGAQYRFQSHEQDDGGFSGWFLLETKDVKGLQCLEMMSLKTFSPSWEDATASYSSFTTPPEAVRSKDAPLEGLWRFVVGMDIMLEELAGRRRDAEKSYGEA